MYDCMPAHSRKNVYAIKWYLKHIEHVGMEEFDVKSNYVQIALEKVKGC